MRNSCKNAKKRTGKQIIFQFNWLKSFIYEPSLRKWMNVAVLTLRKGKVVIKMIQESVEKARHLIWLKRDNQ